MEKRISWSSCAPSGAGEDLVQDGDALHADDAAEGLGLAVLQQAAEERRLAVAQAQRAR